MIRIVLLLAAGLMAATAAGAAEPPYHREDLRLPYAAAGPRGLEAMLLRPGGGGRHPLAVISHGSPRDAAERPQMSPYRLYEQAAEFTRRGFAALVVMRRGYGTSGGEADSSGPCNRRDYLASAKESGRDLRAAITAVAGRPDVTTEGMIAVGQSAGGLATVALVADPPPGLRAGISFAGGRGSRADNDVCDPDALVAAFAALGRTARLPMLWVYAENDLYFGPALAARLHGAFTGSGGEARFIKAAPFGEDGHRLFAQGIALWTPWVDAFLREQKLGTPARDKPPLADIPPPKLGAKGVAGFQDFLAAAPHKAFATSPRGAFAWRSRLRSADEARAAALQACAGYGADCTLYAVDDAREAQ
jgi:dienelactone hydrolase